MSEYAQGGYVESDAPMPLLSHCDYVIRAEQAKRFGYQFLKDVAREFGIELDDDDE